MDTSLKTFIRENREQFDVHEPSDLWMKISSQLTVKPATASKNISSNLLKKGLFMVTAATIAVSSYLYFSKKEKPVSLVPQTELNIEKNEQAILTTDTATKKTDQTISSVAAQNKIVPFIPNAPSVPETAFILPENEAGSTPENNPVAENPPVNAAYPETDTLSDIKDSLFNGIKRIEIEGDLFNVYVKSYPGKPVLFHKESHISAHGLHSKINQYKVITEKKDSVLKISIDCDGKKGILIVGSIIVTASMDLSVPEGTEIYIRNSSGNIRVNGLKGKVDVASSSGNIRLEDINTNMKLYSVSGDISSKKCTGDLQIETSSGNQLLEEINGNIKLKSISGDCKLTNIKGNLSASSSSGNQILSGITGTIHSTSISGDIKSTDCKGDLFIRTSSGDVIGKNDQLSSASELESVSGNIYMDFSNDMNDLSFDLETISGNLSVNNEKEVVRDEKRLLLKQGTIRVKGITSSGNQFFK